MFSKRIAMAVLSAMLLSILTVAPAAAKRPIPPPSDGGDERPLTAEELALSDAKVAAAEAHMADVEASGGDLVTLACFTPESTTAEATGTDATTQSCYVPQAYLPVYARDQTRGHYCGPAVGQVIANYSWAMKSTSNKYLQSTIATWMSTDVYGGTNAYYMAKGLNTATHNSPREPGTWTWVVTYLNDSDRDGTTGDQLHNYVRANVSGSKMPLAIPVKPHDRLSKYHLASWPNQVASPGHWIAGYGWYGAWTGNTFARTYYTDSSRDEGGATGKYWDPTLHIAKLIGEHTRRFVW